MEPPHLKVLKKERLNTMLNMTLSDRSGEFGHIGHASGHRQHIHMQYYASHTIAESMTLERIDLIYISFHT